MAIPLGITGHFGNSGKITDITTVPLKKFTLASLSDTAGLTDPQTGKPVSARAIRVNVAGTISLVDPSGNITAEVVVAGELVRGWCNGVRNTDTVTITASDVTVYL